MNIHARVVPVSRILRRSRSLDNTRGGLVYAYHSPTSPRSRAARLLAWKIGVVQHAAVPLVCQSNLAGAAVCFRTERVGQNFKSERGKI